MSFNTLALTPSPSASILDPMGYTQTSFLASSALPTSRRLGISARSGAVEGPEFSQFIAGENSDRLSELVKSAKIDASLDGVNNVSQLEPSGVPVASDFQKASESAAVNAGGYLEFGNNNWMHIPAKLYFNAEVLFNAGRARDFQKRVEARPGQWLSMKMDEFEALHRVYLDFVYSLSMNLLSPQLSNGFRAAQMLDLPSIAAAQKLGNIVWKDAERNRRQRALAMVNLVQDGDDTSMLQRFMTSEGIDLPSNTMSMTRVRQMLVFWSYGYLQRYTERKPYFEDVNGPRLEWKAEVIEAARWYVETDLSRKPSTLPDAPFRQAPMNPGLLFKNFRLREPGKLLPLVQLNRMHSELREGWDGILKAAGIRSDLANLDEIAAKRAMLNVRRALAAVQASTVDPELRAKARWIESVGSRGDLAAIRLMNVYIVKAAKDGLDSSAVHSPWFKAMHGTAGFAFLIFAITAQTYNGVSGWTAQTAAGAVRAAAAVAYGFGNILRLAGYTVMASYASFFSLRLVYVSTVPMMVDATSKAARMYDVYQSG